MVDKRPPYQRDQLPPLHDAIELLAPLWAWAGLGPKQVTGGDVGEAQPLHYQVTLGPLHTTYSKTINIHCLCFAKLGMYCIYTLYSTLYKR